MAAKFIGAQTSKFVLQDSAKVGYSNHLHIVGGAHDVCAREHYKVSHLYGFRNPRAPLRCMKVKLHNFALALI